LRCRVLRELAKLATNAGVSGKRGVASAATPGA
jgi:hypothetical protein